jgi:hypothetical protein
MIRMQGIFGDGARAQLMRELHVPPAWTVAAGVETVAAAAETSRAGGATSFALAAAERGLRPRAVSAAVSAGTGPGAPVVP